MSDEQKKIFVTIGKVVLIWSLVALIALFLSGCKTVQTVVETRTEYVHDTTQMVDSIWQDRVHYIYQKGDTVYKTDSVFLYKYKYIDKVQETIVRDSIPYEVRVEVPVHVRSGYDKFCSWFFWIVIVLVLLATAWWCFKKFYLHR